MNTSRVSSVFGCVVLATVSYSQPAQSQDLRPSTVLHGQGVHAYFAGNCSQAEGYLSDALAMDSQDPCLYYYRGLSLLRMGRVSEARGDMMVGAALEAQYPGRFAVGKALERVQGHDRLLVEKYRRQARIDAGIKGTSSGVTSTAAYNSAESGVLRQPVRIPLDGYLRSGVPQSTPAAPLKVVPRTFAPPDAGDRAAPQSPEDPFGDDSTEPPAGASPTPETQPTTTAEGGDGAAAPPTTEAAPESAAPAPTNETPPTTDDDPFGSF